MSQSQVYEVRGNNSPNTLKLSKLADMLSVLLEDPIIYYNDETPVFWSVYFRITFKCVVLFLTSPPSRGLRSLRVGFSFGLRCTVLSYPSEPFRICGGPGPPPPSLTGCQVGQRAIHNPSKLQHGMPTQPSVPSGGNPYLSFLSSVRLISHTPMYFTASPKASPGLGTNCCFKVLIWPRITADPQASLCSSACLHWTSRAR